MDVEERCDGEVAVADVGHPGDWMGDAAVAEKWLR